MKFLIVGNSIKDNSLEMSYCRALIFNNYNADTYEMFSNYNFLVKKTIKLFLRFKFFQTFFNFNFLYNDLLKLTEKADYDIIIIFKCWYINKGILNRINNKNKSKLINYNSDHPYSNKYLRSSITRDKIKEYDLICSFSESLKPIWYQLGAKKYLTIPFGCDQKYRLSVSKNFKLKWVYFGTWGPYIEKILYNLSDFKITIFGSGWDKSKRSFKRKFNINPVEFSSKSMYYLANISFGVLNFTRLEHSCLHTMKTFEIPNSGAYYISNFSIEQNNYFKNNTSAIYFDSYEELSTLMNKLESNEIDLFKLKNNAYKDSANHFYSERIKILIKNL